ASSGTGIVPPLVSTAMIRRIAPRASVMSPVTCQPDTTIKRLRAPPPASTCVPRAASVDSWFSIIHSELDRLPGLLQQIAPEFDSTPNFLNNRRLSACRFRIPLNEFHNH
ncbi:MAG: hypothetical protein L0Y39_09765, partial [Methylococcaceae bacterium]|nr:hypothetical protein [Methylococcaceae bacterium]